VFPPRPYGRAVALVRDRDERLALRLVSTDGVRMATRLRPMTLGDALPPAWLVRRRPR
jgi:hypothetical protein